MPARQLLRSKVFFLLLFFPFTLLRAESNRFFRPTEGFIQTKDLPDSFSAQVRSIQLVIKDAFEGSVANSDAEQWVFEIGNKLHIESRSTTIRRRLLFHEGDTITKQLLQETENNLRSEQFLADAIIEVKRWEDGTAHVIVTTYDQWTTTLAFVPEFLGGRFFYQVGVVESNLLGTGQRLGLFLIHERERDARAIEYGDNALSPWRLHLTSTFASLSDGYTTSGSLSKPLATHSDRYGFSVSWLSDELSEFVYFDHNQSGRLPDSVAKQFAGAPALVYRFDRVAHHQGSVSATLSLGHETKVNLSPSVDWIERYNHGAIESSRTLVPLLSPPSSAAYPEDRYDLMAGATFSVLQYDYKTVHNFRNLKWGESIETGWKLSTKLAQNQEWMGARNSEVYLDHTVVFKNAWWDALFVDADASVKYFVSTGGDFDNGKTDASAEVQWRPLSLTSTYLSMNYHNLFAAESSQQLLLGEDSGLNGFPNAYYAGQALLLLVAEQRYFPDIEFGTLVPAFAVFVNAGNTFPTNDDFDPGNLHYSVGMGLRLGFSKTVQKLVWHINLSQPLNEPSLKRPVFSFQVKLSL